MVENQEIGFEEGGSDGMLARVGSGAKLISVFLKINLFQNYFFG